MANNTFLSLEMQQGAGIIPAINRLLDAIKPARIIEIGTGKGALTVFLALYAHYNNARLTTYDNKPRHERYAPLLWYLGAECVELDVWLAVPIIEEEIGYNGTTLVICDGGDKAGEFNTFGPFLKHGDIIMCHDYFLDMDSFMSSDLSKSWDCEVVYKDIQETCQKYNLVPYMPEFYKLMWGVFKRV